MKIFISYSWEISEWLNILMEKLKEKIKNKGMEIEFIWDKTHLKPGNNMHYFMENSIREADKVFLFCDNTYTQKANERNKGVGVETSIITPKLYGEVEQTKFIPIILWNCKVPDYLGAIYGIPIDTKEISDNLIETLLEIIETLVNDSRKETEIIPENSLLNQITNNLDTPLSFSTMSELREKGKFPLTEQGILDEIFNSTRNDWSVDKYEEVFTYKHNILLTIEENPESEREFFEEWANCHPDKRASFYEYEIKYQGKRITNFYLVAVDGYRALLPLPNIKTGKIKEKHMHFANIIFPYPEMNYEYVERSHLEIESD